MIEQPVKVEQPQQEVRGDPLDTDIPEPPAVSVSRMGDLWLMDEHRLYVGSALLPESFEVLMDGRKASMVFQDAPYNARINGHVSGLGKVQHREFAMASGEMSADEFKQFNATNLKAITPHLVDGAILAMCMDWRGALALQLAMIEAALEQINLGVWVKTNAAWAACTDRSMSWCSLPSMARPSISTMSSWADSNAIEPMCGDMQV